ncbi:MAG: hypothetical protein M1817_004297 [Caeruleum heppii]|nr:MAG: hypothetical protein M1817_004297 [Caeruleum heppii]
MPRIPVAHADATLKSIASNGTLYVRFSPILTSSTHQQALPCRSYSTVSPDALIRQTVLPAPHTGTIRILSLNRPEARNAISRELLDELRGTITTIKSRMDQQERDKPRVLILASDVDGCFCAGADLKERRNFTPKETRRFLTTLRHTFTTIATLPIPTITALSAIAVGGGLELALTTTFRVLASSAVLGLPETRLGIVPGAGGTYRLPRLVSRTRALDMILTGRRVGAEEALNWGLVDRVVQVPQEDPTTDGEAARKLVLEESVNLAREICKGGPLAITEALAAIARPRLDEDELMENKAYERVVKTSDRDEALKAFAEKRPAKFEGN